MPARLAILDKEFNAGVEAAAQALEDGVRSIHAMGLEEDDGSKIWRAMAQDRKLMAELVRRMKKGGTT